MLLPAQVLRTQQRQHPTKDEDSIGSYSQDAEPGLPTPARFDGVAVRIGERVGQHYGHRQHVRPRSESEERKRHRDGARSAAGLDDQQITNDRLTTYQKAHSLVSTNYFHYIRQNIN